MAKRAHASIGDVLNQLRDEFSDITISKIRFLESQGLVDPERTPSGYRKFYPSDVERLRFILRQQREHFLPLKVIKERLDEVDSKGGFTVGEGGEGAAGDRTVDPATVDALFEETRRAAQKKEARSASVKVQDVEGPEDLAASESGVSLTRAELVRAAGITDEDLARLEEYGLVAPSSSTGNRVLFDDDSLAIARVCAAFMRHGIEPRHLRMYRAFAERESSLFEQVLLPYRRQRNPEAQARTTETLGELAGLGRRLRTALLRQTVRRTFNN
ncbi:MAG TPA: MerR family transcriptional regulator [Acidimicrobiia bacterium]|nr:MerR family transcriptional regulator [Acidimicrobiia bacterium]